MSYKLVLRKLSEKMPAEVALLRFVVDEIVLVLKECRDRLNDLLGDLNGGTLQNGAVGIYSLDYNGNLFSKQNPSWNTLTGITHPFTGEYQLTFANAMTSTDVDIKVNGGNAGLDINYNAYFSSATTIHATAYDLGGAARIDSDIQVRIERIQH
jgi:hypothetical protein